MSLGIENNDRVNKFNIFNNKNSAFFVQVSNKFQDCIKTQLNRLSKDVERQKSTASVIEGTKDSSQSWEGDLEKQMKAWRENPSWEDKPPEIKVTVPKGTLSNIKLKVNVGLPPDMVYNIVTDPDNKKVFKNIKEVISRRVLVDEGLRQVVEVEQAALWRFLWWSGIISVHVLVDQNRADHTMKFEQIKTGFMKRFEGRWKVEPLFVDECICAPFKPENMADYEACTRGKGRVGSKVSLEQLVQPAIVPPPPISWYLRGITTRTTEMLITDLLAESARLRNSLHLESSNEVVEVSQDHIENPLIDDVGDIKERWRERRRNAHPCQQRRILTK